MCENKEETNRLSQSGCSFHPAVDDGKCALQSGTLLHLVMLSRSMLWGSDRANNREAHPTHARPAAYKLAIRTARLIEVPSTHELELGARLTRRVRTSGAIMNP